MKTIEELDVLKRLILKTKALDNAQQDVLDAQDALFEIAKATTGIMGMDEVQLIFVLNDEVFLVDFDIEGDHHHKVSLLGPAATTIINLGRQS